MSYANERFGSKLYELVILSTERLIGYFFAGVLTSFLYFYNHPAQLRPFLDSVGTTLFVLACFLVGVGVYTIYFRIIGSFILFPFQHIIHLLKDVITGNINSQHTSTIFLLKYYGVPLFRCRDAYESVKEHIFIGETSLSIQVAHGELHILYLISIASLIQVIVSVINKDGNSQYYIVGATLFYFAALIGDTNQHSKEAFRMRNRTNEIRKFLLENGFIYYIATTEDSLRKEDNESAHELSGRGY